MSNKNNRIYYAVETQDYQLGDNPEDLKDFWNWVAVACVGPGLKEAKKEYKQLSEKYRTLRLVQVEVTALKVK